MHICAVNRIMQTSEGHGFKLWFFYEKIIFLAHSTSGPRESFPSFLFKAEFLFFFILFFKNQLFTHMRDRVVPVF